MFLYLKMQVFVHSKCAHSNELTQWMLQNIPDNLQINFELVYANLNDNVLYVPCIVNMGTEIIGFSQCKEFIKTTIDTLSHPKTSARKQPSVDDLPPQYKQPSKLESVEDKFNSLISARKPPSNGPVLPLPERKMPDI